MEPDKLEHLQAGMAIAATVKGLGFSDSQALVLSALAGAAKEALDASRMGTADPWDAVATLLGGLLILTLLAAPLNPPSPVSAGPSFYEASSMDWPIIAPYIVPALMFAAGYGALNSRVSRIEHSHVTRPEVEALSKRLDEVVSEIKGLRSDLMQIIRER